ncbi:50S ribosomal protein L18 [Candidatus Saganbacteria bacterium]|uniref:Large ribosomal subunit protein uL18 n=1 Tax=Candidatus Saganbacteria bacterium TaxID=2575572 RepID=A0A9D6ULY3_UNCSA|nr:50S ribosomal protein L18 [Candidatus Saganbacteria bacterium]
MKKRKIIGTSERPRLSVFASLKNISVQVIDDLTGMTLTSAGTVEKGLVKSGGNVLAARVIGRMIAERAIAKNIKKVVFDRGKFIYHGRIAALAEEARKGGLQF